MSNGKAWWGFDIDKTAFVDEGGTRGGVIGAPIKAIMRRIKYFVRTGRTVCIVTARVHPSEIDAEPQRILVRSALNAALGTEIASKIQIRCDKDRHMIDLYDDRAKQVIPNKGILVENELARAITALRAIEIDPTDAYLKAGAALNSLDSWSLDLVRTTN